MYDCAMPEEKKRSQNTLPLRNIVTKWHKNVNVQKNGDTMLDSSFL
jgi:hypothetical protein